jgi:hypothetical protein
VKPQSIRKEFVARARRTIAAPGFTVDTLKLAERLVAVLTPVLCGPGGYKTNPLSAPPEDSQFSKPRSVESSAPLNEAVKRETP